MVPSSVSTNEDERHTVLCPISWLVTLSVRPNQISLLSNKLWFYLCFSPVTMYVSFSLICQLVKCVCGVVPSCPTGLINLSLHLLSCLIYYCLLQCTMSCLFSNVFVCILCIVLLISSRYLIYSLSIQSAHPCLSLCVCIFALSNPSQSWLAYLICH